jgi:hypothetical protein
LIRDGINFLNQFISSLSSSRHGWRAIQGRAKFSYKTTGCLEPGAVIVSGENALNQGAAHHHRIGNRCNPGRGFTIANTEAHGNGQIRMFANIHEPVGNGRRIQIAGARRALERNVIDKSTCQLCNTADAGAGGCWSDEENQINAAFA